MATELARIHTTEVPDQLDVSVMEKVMVQGDLAKLSSGERLNFYGSLCKSLGLNPLTCPFEYLNLNGKLRLYAKKECTEQLRLIRNVSVQIVAREVVEGCYVVTASAKLTSGRQDESTGAVAIDGLKGEARANAMMKAETKAKRRVTLSICGLAFLDESELESVRNAVHATVDHGTGEILDPGGDLTTDIKTNPQPKGKKGTTPFDILKHFGEMKKRFVKLGKEDVYRTILPKWGVEKSNQFPATEDGEKAARGCWKEMQLAVQELEHKAAQLLAGEKLEPPRNIVKVDDWIMLDNQPDWVEVAGITYHYNTDAGKYEPWIPTK